MKCSALLLVVAALIAPRISTAQTRWEPDIRAFEQMDVDDPPPTDAVLFVGSSSIRMWTTADEDFPDVDVINRGFGGSQMEDVIYYAHRIVIPYAPDQIVLYEGDNDIAAGKSADEVFADYRGFVALVRNRLPRTRIAFIAIKPSLARWELASEMQRANALIAHYASEREGLAFIDVWDPMLAEDGTPRADLFLDDGLHMNELGYDIWQEAVAPFLASE